MKVIPITIIVLVLAVSVSASTELTDPVVIGNLGFYAYEQGREDLAEALFLRALEEDPHYEHARFNLATLYNQQGRYREAINELEVLTDLNTNNIQYHYDLGVNYIAEFRQTYQASDFHAGVSAYEAAANIDASFAHVQENLIALNRIQGEFNI